MIGGLIYIALGVAILLKVWQRHRLWRDQLYDDRDVWMVDREFWKEL